MATATVTATRKKPMKIGAGKVRHVTHDELKRIGEARSIVVPMLGETQSAFFLRADRALRKTIPSVNRRTVHILELWRKSPNDRDLRDKAATMFPRAKFQRFGPRCIFLSHTIPASEDGSRPEIRYGQKELQQLVDWANYRIRNSDNFAAISDGHTPSQEEKEGGAPTPDVLGYCGPFYLGLLGDVDPLWAIYADEWVHVDDVARFEKLQRRSPEVWSGEPMERRTLDPIAALGAETPRLDCGMNAYSRAGDGRLVMRYSAATSAVAVLPGAYNSYVPSAGKRRKTSYSGDSPMPPLPGEQDDLSTKIGEAIQAIVPTLVQTVLDRINGGDGDTPPAEDDDGADADAGLASGPPVARGLVDDDGDDETPSDHAEPDADNGVPAGDDSPDDEEAKYKAMGQQCYAAYMAGRRSAAGATKYSRGSRAGGGDAGLAAVVASQANRIKRMEQDIARERRDAVRYQRLSSLSREFAFELDDEFKTVEDMTDAQFDRHCTATVTKYSRRDDITGLDLPDDLEVDRYSRSSGSGRSNVKEEDVIRYSREAASRAVAKNAKKRGSTTFEDEFAAICKERGISI